jgi:hypothetical protein
MGFKVKDFPYELRVGRDISAVSSLAATVADQENDFDFIMVDVCHAMNYRNQKTIETRDIALTRAGKLRMCLIFNRYEYQKRVLAGLRAGQGELKWGLC